MKALDLLVEETKCDIVDALNYFNAKESFMEAFMRNDKALVRYQQTYITVSDRIYGKKYDNFIEMQCL